MSNSRSSGKYSDTEQTHSASRMSHPSLLPNFDLYGVPGGIKNHPATRSDNPRPINPFLHKILDYFSLFIQNIVLSPDHALIIYRPL